MRNALLAVVAMTIAGVGSSMAKSPPPADRFSVTIDYTATSWSAKCEVGCKWEASFSCANACDARVDGRGIVTLAEGRPADSLFNFIVRRAGDGVRAEARSGTIWKTLGWSCGTVPCRARVSDAGVYVSP